MTAVPPFCSRVGIVLLLSCFATFANDPGGGTNGVGANVTVTPSGGNVILANGILSATIITNSGQISSMTYGGRQLVNGNIYFSMDGGTSYEQPGSCVYTIKSNSTDMVDLGFRCIGLNRIHKFDIDVHYVLRRGDSGIYVYAQLDHPAAYTNTGYGEWRMVWKMNQDPTERIYVDNIRNWQKPSSFDLANAQATGIAEIIKLTTGPWAGRYDCKYMYSCEYEKVGCYGHASNTNKFGVWAVFGGYDYFNDGPTKQDLAPASGIIHIHFGRNHYNGSGLTVVSNETWSKIYGPWLLYCNTNSGGGDACWADAKAQVVAEKGAWPYAWLTGNTNYPAASLRGGVSGTLVFSDALKAGVTASNAWVGLADPSVADWQFESKFYQYWYHADSNGNFTIPSVRPGTYTLHAFNDGAVGEYAVSNVVVTAGTTNALGTLTWNIPHLGGYIAWEIGKPDRLPSEFRHGTNHWEPYIWDFFTNDFPNPINFNLDSGNAAWDLNYAHNFYGVSNYVWNWNLNFTLPAEPANSNARLTIATAGGEQAHLYVYVNGSKRGDFYPANAGGNSLLRQGAHDKYGVNYVTFNASTFLNAGTNTIVLQQVNSSPATGNHTMYDYIALEMPGSAPAVQFLMWTGGQSGNAWDATSTNWSAYAQPRLFTSGGKILFNEVGASNSTVNLTAALTPGQVVVNAVRDYTITGVGSLGGAMTLVKRGPGALNLQATNTYSGDTTIESGTLRGVETVPNAFSPNSRLLLDTDATLDLNSSTQTTGPLADPGIIGGLVTNSAPTAAALTLNAVSGTNIFSGAIDDAGTSRTISLLKSGAGTQVLSGRGSFAGSLVVSNGTLSLANGFSVATSPVILVHAGAKLDVSALTAGNLTLASGQSLKGGGALLGEVTIGSGATLSPGLSFGTLSFSNSLWLASGSTNVMEIGKAPLTNDQVIVAGTLTYGGTLTVSNAGGTLAAGDNFKLFSAALYAGSFASTNLPAPGAGNVWKASRLPVDGTLWIISTNPPVFSGVSASAGGMIASGAGGTPGWPYVVLTATNLTQPIGLWDVIATNVFDSAGGFAFTNAVSGDQRFFLIQAQP